QERLVVHELEAVHLRQADTRAAEGDGIRREAGPIELRDRALRAIRNHAGTPRQRRTLDDLRFQRRFIDVALDRAGVLPLLAVAEEARKWHLNQLVDDLALGIRQLQ